MFTTTQAESSGWGRRQLEIRAASSTSAPSNLPILLPDGIITTFPLPLAVPGTLFGDDGSETIFGSDGRANLTAIMPPHLTVTLVSGDTILLGDRLDSTYTYSPQSTSSFSPPTSSQTNTATPITSQPSHTPTKLAADSQNGLPGSAKAGIAIGVIAISVVALLGIFFFNRRRKSYLVQDVHRNTSNENLPEVQASSEARPTFFNSIAEKIRYRHHVAELPEDNTLPAELSTGISVRRKKLNIDSVKPVRPIPPTDPLLSIPELYGSADGPGLAVPERPTYTSLVSAESPSGLAGPIMQKLPTAIIKEDSGIEMGGNAAIVGPARASSASGESPLEASHPVAEQAATLPGALILPNSTSSTASEVPGIKIAKAVELARLKDTAARLQEKRRRLQQLTEIEDEEAEVRKRIADLEDNN